jgi:hypothetical protein
MVHFMMVYAIVDSIWLMLTHINKYLEIWNLIHHLAATELDHRRGFLLAVLLPRPHVRYVQIDNIASAYCTSYSGSVLF